MNNRIPRAATRLTVTWTHDTSACKAGTTTEVYKDEYGWHMYHNGKFYGIPVSMLRNGEICRIQVKEG